MELTNWQLELMEKKERGVWKAPLKTFAPHIGNFQELSIISEPPQNQFADSKSEWVAGVPRFAATKGRRETFQAFGAFIRKGR